MMGGGVSVGDRSVRSWEEEGVMIIVVEQTRVHEVGLE